MIILSGDIGGTKTRLKLTKFEENGKARALKQDKFINNDYSSFIEVIDNFLNGTDTKVEAACFGVAGPIINDSVRFTNLSWAVSANDIKNKFNSDKVALLNDFAAIGYGLETLKEEDISTLQTGKPVKDAIIAYTGAGTGLGVGFITRCQENYKVHSTEGGHVDFAPTNEVQIELLKFLRKKHHRVCNERLLSGQGLINIYSFVRSQNGSYDKTSSELNRIIDEGHDNIDVAATIAEYATKRNANMAKRALSIFIRIYGTVVGNLALSTLPFGGLYIVGGIAPKLLTQIKEWGFLEEFQDKGRMTGLVKDIPLHVVLCTDVGLQGAALYAKKFLT